VTVSATKRDPKAPPKVLILTKESVALSQLETAISLWFNYGDPVSILQLAAAANDCYSALGAHAGQPSFYQTWLKSQSKGFQDRARYAHNWIKHGKMDMKKRPRCSPRLAEVLMIDSVDCHRNLTGKNTPLTRIYVLRFAFENPEIVVPQKKALFLKGIEVENILDLDRIQFLQVFLERLFASSGA
jgi:hypothetical protein